MTTTITIQDSVAFRQTLKDTLLFASTDRMRPVLTAVELATVYGGFELRATDSYALMIANVEAEASAPVESAIIPSEFVKQLISIIPSKAYRNEPVTLELTETTITATMLTGAVITGRLMDSQYPKVTEILANAKKEPGELGAIGLGANILAKLSKVAHVGSSKNAGTPMHIAFGATNLKPALVTWPSAPRYSALIMPCRVSE